MEFFAYFPAVICRDERPDIAQSILEESNAQLKASDTENNEIVQSNFLLNNLAFKDVSNYLLISSVEILRNQGYSVNKYDFYLSGLWAQQIKNTGFTNVHVHKNSQICGWLFLEVPENGAYPIYFDCRENKRMIELDFEQGNEITNATNIVNFSDVKQGTVLFGSSWMQHQLVTRNSSVPTKCIHFIVSHKERQCNTY
jgi:hypothetical protein